ncbi:phage minor capsid protein [Psychrobacillus sp. OK032]|uniref:phage minor capsid protein n=1 Tax=Psychrobacillus sp. OK032 TaxID=1884358 RepID=UPI0008C83AD3|nr:phage minor capsid protein [Psychrobacillus sp. OK032]SER87478.1 Phage minor capsid protein 2 [Psychrobacillus sp. OK032]
MPDIPQPTYDYDINKLTKAYERALRDVRSELDTLFLSDFERAQIIATERNISRILSDMAQYGDEWAALTTDKAFNDGIARTIMSLHLAETFEDALKIAQFNGVNRRLAAAMIADTQADLLAVTQNIERRTRVIIRKASAEVIRAQTASGINGVRSIKSALSKELRKQLGAEANEAIIDASGRRWKVSHYTEMLARTKLMQAQREASINEAIDEGAYYGVISTHGATDACRGYEGKIVKLIAEAPGDYPYIDELPRREIFHPNCKHVVSPLRDPSRTSADIRRINGN